MSDIKILRSNEVREMTGLKRTTIHNLVKAGEFPAPMDVAGNRSGWFKHEVVEWINARPRKGQRAAACMTVPSSPAVTVSVAPRAVNSRASKKKVSLDSAELPQTVPSGPTSQGELPL